MPLMAPRASATARADARPDIEASLRALAPDVLRVCRGVVGRADAEDAAQEALIQLARALPSFRGEGSLRGFARRVAVRAALRFRRDRRAPAQPLAADPAAAPAQEEDLARVRLRELLRELLGELPAAQAETLALRFVLGHTLQEVAEATGVPVNTVRSRVRLARAALVRRLESEPALRPWTEVHHG